MKVPLPLYELSIGLAVSDKTLLTKEGGRSQFDYTLIRVPKPLGLQPLYNVI